MSLLKVALKIKMGSIMLAAFTFQNINLVNNSIGNPCLPN